MENVIIYVPLATLLAMVSNNTFYFIYIISARSRYVQVIATLLGRRILFSDACSDSSLRFIMPVMYVWGLFVNGEVFF